MIDSHPLAVDLDAILDRTQALWVRMRGQRLFITGGTGFFGCWMLESLCWTADRLGHGVQATVLSRDAEGIRRRLPHLADHPALSLLVGDVATFAAPAGPFDAVIHMAALPDGPAYRDRPEEMMRTLVQGTHHVAEAAGRWKARRFLHISSGAVYGPQPVDVERLSEDAPSVADARGDRSIYGEGKCAAESVARRAAQTHGFDCVVARPFAFIGPYLPIGSGFAAGEFLADALAGRPIHVVGDGTPVRTYLYAADLATWLWTLLVEGQGGTAYNVGGDVPITIAELARLVAHAVEPPVAVEIARSPTPGQLPSRYVPDTAKARGLGLTATVPLPEAIKSTLRWLNQSTRRHWVIEQDMQQILNAPLPWQRILGKSILISGASGLLPAYMVETLLALNERHPRQAAKVIGLVRNRERAERRFAAYRGRPDLEFVVQDVRDPVPPNVRADFIIHAASPSSPKYYGRDPVGTIDANVRGTENLLELARRSGALGFLFLSTSEVYGRLADEQVPVREDEFGPLDPTDVRSCYAESKRLGESLCAAWAAEYGVPTKIVRPFHTYGPGMRMDDGRVFADFTADVLARRPITLRSSGASTRSFCYLSDSVIGFFTVLFLGDVGCAYNVGDDAGEISIRGLAELLVALFPERGLSVKTESRSADDQYLISRVERSCPDISRLRRLGWQPTTTLEEGFRRTVASYS